MSPDAVASGVVVPLARTKRAELASLAKESNSMLRALQAESRAEERATPDADFVILLVEAPFDAGLAPLPDLRDRVGAALALAANEGDARVAVQAARKHLRSAGAALGARELVLTDAQFGVMGLEDDSAREKLEILLRTLVLDAERLRLRREGWEEPERRESV